MVMGDLRVCGKGAKTFRRFDTPQGSERCQKGMSVDEEV